MAQIIRWPEAVYFDASILRRLPADLASPDLVRLTEVATRFQIGRYIPAVARREWLVFYQESVKGRYEGLHASARSIGEILGRELRVDAVTPEELVAVVERTQAARLDAAGLVEIPTPAVPLERLVDLAIRRVKPFADEDRGFRDMLIAMAIAEHARAFAGRSILVVSADKVFSAQEVLALWRAAGVHPIIATTLESAVEQLEAEMDQAWKTYLNQEAEAIKAFLVTRQQEIFDRLKEAEVSESFIRGNPLSGGPPLLGALERIRRVTPVEITRVSRGHVLGPTQREGNRVPVTFYVKVAFDLSVRYYPLSSVLGGSGPRFRLADAVDLPVGPSSFITHPGTVEDTTVDREIAIQAWVEEAGGQFSELIIEKIAAW